MSPARYAALFFFCVLSAACRPERQTREPYNVLFIAVDDLRPDLGSFGESYMVTPSLDRLASEGRPFSRHFVQVPTCGASRYAHPAYREGFALECAAMRRVRQRRDIYPVFRDLFARRPEGAGAETA